MAAPGKVPVEAAPAPRRRCYRCGEGRNKISGALLACSACPPDSPRLFHSACNSKAAEFAPLPSSRASVGENFEHMCLYCLENAVMEGGQIVACDCEGDYCLCALMCGALGEEDPMPALDAHKVRK